MNNGRSRLETLRLCVAVEELDILIRKAYADLHTEIIPEVVGLGYQPGSSRAIGKSGAASSSFSHPTDIAFRVISMLISKVRLWKLSSLPDTLSLCLKPGI